MRLRAFPIAVPGTVDHGAGSTSSQRRHEPCERSCADDRPRQRHRFRPPGRPRQPRVSSSASPPQDHSSPETVELTPTSSPTAAAGSKVGGPSYREEREPTIPGPAVGLPYRVRHGHGRSRHVPHRRRPRCGDFDRRVHACDQARQSSPDGLGCRRIPRRGCHGTRVLRPLLAAARYSQLAGPEAPGSRSSSRMIRQLAARAGFA